MKNLLFFSALLALVLVSCDKELSQSSAALPVPVLPDQLFDYTTSDIDSGFAFDNTPSDNIMTNEGAQLGRVLFYDPALSINNRISCGTCHSQEFSFADGKQFSEGYANRITHRNTPGLVNLRFSNQFFWDMSQHSLEEQVIMPIQNHIEMGIEDIEYLSEKLQNKDYYPPLFEQAFGTAEVTTDNIGKALAQFIRSMDSGSSRFDIGSTTDFENFTAIERTGLAIFKRVGCNDCHSVLGNSTFFFDGTNIIDFEGGGFYGGTGEDAANIGLDMHYADQGRGNGVFKVPSLRNIALTAPYMHDGRFNTLDEVLDHYQFGVQQHENLDFRLKNANLDMTLGEREALKAFMLTLHDDRLVSDVKWSDPFSE